MKSNSQLNYSEKIDEPLNLFVYFNFLIIGCCSLLPWNSLITATEYFKYKFCDTPYEHLFESYFTTFFNLAQLLGLVSQLYLEIYYDYRHTIQKPLLFSSIFFTLLSVSCFFKLSGSSYFYFCIPIIFSLGVSTIYLTCGVFARAASYVSPMYSQGTIVGQALAGVFVSLLSYFLDYDLPSADFDDDYILDTSSSTSCGSYQPNIIGNATNYFAIVTVIMWITFSIFSFSRFNKIILYNQNQNQNQNQIDVRLYDPIDEKPEVQMVLFDDSYNTPDSAESQDSPISNNNKIVNIFKGSSEIFDVINKLKLFIVVILITFSGTLSIFPSLVSEIWECNNIDNPGFTGILFFTFNLADALGRFLSVMAPEFNYLIFYFILSLSILKLLIIPLMFHSNIHGEYVNTDNCSDIYSIFLVLFLGLTNGFCVGCCMIHWPQVLGNPLKENTGATIMIFSINIGLLTGSLFSYIMIQSVFS